MLKSYIHTRTQSLKAGIHIGSMIYSTGMMILPRQQPHVTHSTHTVLVLYTSRISGLLYTYDYPAAEPLLFGFRLLLHMTTLWHRLHHVACTCLQQM